MNIDLVKENNRYSFYYKEKNSKSNNVSVLEKNVFDEKWNEMETIKFNDGKVYFHKIYHYNGENQIVEIQDLIENSSKTFKYDNKGNLILADNNYLLMYKNYDKNNNVVLDYKIFKETGILKEVHTYKIEYKNTKDNK